MCCCWCLFLCLFFFFCVFHCAQFPFDIFRLKCRKLLLPTMQPYQFFIQCGIVAVHAGEMLVKCLWNAWLQLTFPMDNINSKSTWEMNCQMTTRFKLKAKSTRSAHLIWNGIFLIVIQGIDWMHNNYFRFWSFAFEQLNQSWWIHSQ